MKSIYFVRHAKSDKGNPMLRDFDRPLNERGYRDAYFMSEQMKKQKQIPEIIVSSPAVRAYSTALIFLKNFGMKTSRLVLNENLYEQPSGKYIDEIKLFPENFKSVMLVAHNPTITEIANSLSDESIDEFSTCGIARIDFDMKRWDEIDSKNGRKIFFDFPKRYFLEGPR